MKCTVGLGSVAEIERLIICGIDRKATDQKVVGELPNQYMMEAICPAGTPEPLLQSL